MVIKLTFSKACLFAGALTLIQVASADTTTIIMQGKVVMSDGSPPPKSVGIERICSDEQGSAPGPITDKNGHYLWRQELDPMLTRVCFMRATLAGFTSTRIDISNMSIATFAGGTNEKTMPDLVLSPRDSGEANSIALIADSEAPGKAQAPYKLAVKAFEANNTEEGIRQLQAAVKAVPKFADGWNILGAAYERSRMLNDARDALQHAIDVNPKLLSPYLRLARIDNKLGQWDAAAKAEDALLKLDRRFYPEIYLHQGITRLEMKDLAGAEESLKTAQSLDVAHKMLRTEYVLGMLALAKGDVNGARQHLTTYVQADSMAEDVPRIAVQLETLGKPDAPKADIALERP